MFFSEAFFMEAGWFFMTMNLKKFKPFIEIEMKIHSFAFCDYIFLSFE